MLGVILQRTAIGDRLGVRKGLAGVPRDRLGESKGLPECPEDRLGLAQMLSCPEGVPRGCLRGLCGLGD